MLPDIPQIKKDLSKAQSDFLGMVFRGSMGVLNRAAKTVLWEGNSHGISHSIEELDSNRFSSTFGDLQLNFSGETLGTVFAKLLETGLSMGKDAERVGLENLSAFLTKNGRATSIGGDSDAERLLNILDSIEYSLGDNDQLDLSNVAFIGNADIVRKHENALNEIGNNDLLIERLNQILEKKRQDAITRKTNRKLVR